MKKYFTLSFKILFSASILVFLFFRIPFKEIISSLESANILLIIISLVIILVCNYLSAYETSYLINVQEMSIPTLKILKIHLASMFYSFLLPGGIAGGAVKWYKYSKYASRSDAAAVIVVNRYLELFMLLFTGIGFSSQVFIKRGYFELFIIWVFIVLTMLILFFLMLNSSALIFIKKITLSLPVSVKVSSIIIKFFTSMQNFQNLTKEKILKVFGLLFLYHSLGVFASYLLAESLNLNLSFFDSAWIRSVIGIASLIPISFAGLGVREGSLILLLGGYGISPGKSMGYSFLLFFCSIVISLLGGIIELSGFLKREKTIIINSETTS